MLVLNVHLLYHYEWFLLVQYYFQSYYMVRKLLSHLFYYSIAKEKWRQRASLEVEFNRWEIFSHWGKTESNEIRTQNNLDLDNDR